jgi:hypothetical protein
MFTLLLLLPAVVVRQFPFVLFIPQVFDRSDSESFVPLNTVNLAISACVIHRNLTRS